ncbi:MAG: MBL fold metallo-hydrolase [Ktedonobacteraceae bacterium]|nr:MBL fold metallo-hydrolase [Ktedonobacteraceae bacterium]
MPDFSVQEIVPGVMAALGGVCNRGIISQGGNVLVVDSGVAAAEAIPLHTAAQQYQKEGSLYLFNTHPHGDHVYGNQVFVDSPIIAHEGVRNDLIANGERTLANWKQNPRMAAFVSEVTITPPTVTFQDKMTVFVGDVEVQLLYLGIAHSPSDSVAWLPQFRVLFAGDLLFNAIVPAMPPGGNSATWVHALEQLEQLGAEHAIPGHGPIQTPAALTDLRQWFVTLRAQVSEAIAQGWDRETTITKVAQQMQEIAPRSTPERLSTGIGQVFDEMSRKAHE